MWKWIVVALLVAHGLAHAVGVMGSLVGRELEGISGRPTIDVGRFEQSFAVLWLIALVVFLGAAAALTFGLGSWRLLALGAVVVSSVAVAVWWDDAWRGAIPNALLLLAVAAAPRIPGLVPD
jgi:hypothetical protein